MKYKLIANNIWQQGPRENQEDSIFPEYGKITEKDRLFILCDGMGGHSAGEVASRAVCSAMSESVLKNCPDEEAEFTDDLFNRALSDAFDLLDTKDDGAEKKMGTTMTFLKFHSGGCTIAHIGDSRVYHIRPGKEAGDTEILFQTVDHSLINDLIKIGELTPEEAKSSKQKNIITRAMQPCMERREKADIHHIVDIKPGDYFMLCSDGILEQMGDENIRYIFSERGGDLADKVDMLEKVTDQNRDNHSAILVMVTDVIDPIPVSDAGDSSDMPDYLMAQVEEEDSAGAETSETDNEEPHDISQTGDAGQEVNPNRRRIISVVLLLLLCLLGFYTYKIFFKKELAQKSGQEIVQEQEPPVSEPSVSSKSGQIRQKSESQSKQKKQKQRQEQETSSTSNAGNSQVREGNQPPVEQTQTQQVSSVSEPSVATGNGSEATPEPEAGSESGTGADVRTPATLAEPAHRSLSPGSNNTDNEDILSSDEQIVSDATGRKNY